MDFSETIEVKVVDPEERLLVDSYFFAYFHNINFALDQIRDSVKAYKPYHQNSSTTSEIVHDTTGLRPSSSVGQVLDRTVSLPVAPEPTVRSSYGLNIKLSSLLRPFASDSATPVLAQLSKLGDGSQLKGLGLTTSPSTMSMKTPQSSKTAADSTPPPSQPDAGTVKLSEYHHTYPPPPSPLADLIALPLRDNPSGSSWSVPAWLKGPSRRVFSIPSASSSGTTFSRKGISEIITNPRGPEGTTSDYGFSVLETKDVAEPEVMEKFRSAFAFGEKEQLLGCKLV